MRFSPSLFLLSLPWFSECADRDDINPRKGTEAFYGTYFGFIPSIIGPKNHNSLKTFHLEKGQVSGRLPTELGMLTGLTGFVVAENSIQGTLPTELGAISNMFDSFEIRGNSFSGEIPHQLSFLTALTSSFIIDQEIDGEGSLGGTIPPELSDISLLKESFVLRGLHASGSLPSELFMLFSLSGQFQVSFNHELGGTLPTEIGLMTNVKEVLLNGNQFSGSIPTQVGSLTNVERGLVLSQNAFSGTVPTQLGCLSQLKTFLDIGDNSLIGELPTELGNLENFEYGFIFRGNAYLETVAIPEAVAALSLSMHDAFRERGGYDDGHLFSLEDPNKRVLRRELLSNPTPAPTYVQATPEAGDRPKHQFDVFDNIGSIRCPNECSGHGLCRDPGICECYMRGNNEPAWMMNDCSLRTCPKYVCFLQQFHSIKNI